MEQGEDVNYQESREGLTPLIQAATRGSLEMCKLLLTGKPLVNLHAYDGTTAFLRALKRNHREVCKELIINGADIHIECNEGNALIIAAEVGDYDTVRFLIANGFETNTQQPETLMTPLMKAAFNNWTEICHFLVSVGANVEVQEKYGLTAADLAKIHFHDELHNFLEYSRYNRNRNPITEGRRLYMRNTDQIAKQQKHIMDVEKIVESQDEELNSIRSKLSAFENELKQHITLITKRDTEILDLKHEIKKNGLNNSDSGWLIQKAKNAHEESFNTRQAANIYDIPIYQNEFIEAVTASKIIVSNFLQLLNQCASKKITTNHLLEHMSEQIQKIETQMEVYHENRQSQLKLNTEKYQAAESNLNDHIRKIDYLFTEILKLEKIRMTLEIAKATAERDLDKNQYELTEATLLLNQSKKTVAEIKEIEKVNKEFFEEWNKKIAQPNPAYWNNDKDFLRFLLEIVNLEDWFDEIQTQLLAEVNLVDLRPVQLMGVKKKLPKSQNVTTISWVQAKYLCCVIEEIKTNKKVPVLVNDIDLETRNIKMWPNENLVSYFKNLGMTEVASIFSKLHLNGLCFFYSNEHEINQLGIKNLQDLNSVLNQLKIIQNQTSKATQSTAGLLSNPPPESVVCPLSLQVMVDPVIAQDGYTYERKAIEEWFKNNSTSPLSQEEIEKILVPNKMARELCAKWRLENGQ